MIGSRLSVEALPYTLLLLLGQFAAGSALLTLYAQLRGTFEGGFIRVCSWLVISATAMAAVLALVIDPPAIVDGYPLETRVFGPLRGVLLAAFLFGLVYFYFLRRDEESFLATATGATTVGLSAVGLLLMAQLVQAPAWSVFGVALMLVAGALTLGAVTVAMIWGHWYLVNPRLPPEPMNEIALVALAAVLFQLGVTALNAAIPVGQEISTDALLAVALQRNPAFWLRVGVGLVFPAALAYMAYRSSQESAMMSATGLLYIAVGAVLAGEAVGRGLLFVTAAPV